MSGMRLNKKRACMACAAALLLVFTLIVVLLFTPVGVRLLCFGIEQASGGMVQVGGVSGRLFGGFSISDIRIIGAGEAKDGGRLKQLELQWSPAALLQGKLHIKKMVGDGFYLRKKEEEEAQAQQRADSGSTKKRQTAPLFAMPLEIIVDDGRITNFFYDRGVDSDGDARTSFIFDSIDIAGSIGKQGLVLRKLRLDGPDMAADLHGSCRAVERNQSPQLTLDGAVRFAGFGFHSMSGEISIAGTFKQMEVAASLHKPGKLAVAGTLHNFLADDTFWQAELDASDFDLSLWIKHCPQIVVQKGAAEMTGDFSHYKGHALFFGNWGKLEDFTLEGNLYGDGEKIDFSSLGLRQNEAVVEVDGGWLSWRDVFDTRGEFTLKNIDPALFLPGIDGKLDGHFSMESGVDGEDYKGVFKDIVLEGELHNRPLSARGSLFLCNTALQTEGLYIQSAMKDQRKKRGSIAIEKAAVDLGEGGSWQGKFFLQRFDPAAIFSEYPGRVDAEIESKGHFPSLSTPLSASLQIKKLAGELRGQKLHGTGMVSIDDNFVQSEGLFLQLGRAELHLSKGAFAFGQPLLPKKEKALPLRLDAHLPAMEELVPGSKGSLFLIAQLSGSGADPVGNIQFYGEELFWHDLFFRQLDVDFAGSIKEHRLEFTGDGSYVAKPFTAHLVASGGFAGDFTFVSTALPQWQGQILQGELDLYQYGRWLQQGVSSVIVGEKIAAIDNFSLQSSAAALSSSLSLKKEKDDNDWHWQAEAKIEDMELRQWQEMFELPVDLTGVFSADFTASGEGAIPVSADFSAKLPATTITREDFFVHGEAIELVDGSVVGQLQNGLLAITGGFREKSSGNLLCEVQIGKKNEPFSGDLPLDGKIESNGIDVGLLGNFLSYSQPVGRLYSELLLAGTLRQPKLSGKLSLAGGVGILSQGISLKNPAITLWANSQETRFQGRAFSGEGFVDVNGFLRYDDGGVMVDCSLYGRDFLAVDLPEYTFVVDPDIHFYGDLHKGGYLDGDIAVVSGTISPSHLPDTISQSDDVIVIREEAPPPSLWHLAMNMGVDFGENVHIDGYGLTGKVKGKLQLVMTEEQLLAASGALQLEEGKFTMYGRSLDITRGNIIFSGGPIDNPGVDVRAEKEMSSEQTLEDGYTVGVDITGLAQDLHYNLFSSPPMSETEILSYMVLGHSLAGSDAGEGSILAAAAEQLGLGGSTILLGDLGKLLSFDDLHLEGSVEKEDISLVVGKRLTRDIYVGYDVNMYSQLGEFWIRYNLGKGFSVQTFSSSQSTGGDLQFSFDR